MAALYGISPWRHGHGDAPPLGAVVGKSSTRTRSMGAFTILEGVTWETPFARLTKIGSTINSCVIYKVGWKPISRWGPVCDLGVTVRFYPSATLIVFVVPLMLTFCCCANMTPSRGDHHRVCAELRVPGAASVHLCPFSACVLTYFANCLGVSLWRSWTQH
jgi:hypothetical protein